MTIPGTRFATRLLVSLIIVMALTLYTSRVLTVHAQPAQVEVFDVSKGRVVDKFDNSPDIRREALNWIGSISDIVTSVNPEPKEGIIVGIALDPPLFVQNKWMQDHAAVLFVIISRATVNHPTLLLIDDKSKPHLFQAQVDLSDFVNKHNLQRFLQQP